MGAKSRKITYRYKKITILSLLAIILALLSWAGFYAVQNKLLSERADSYIGLTEEQAKQKASREGVRFRVVEKNGQMIITTDDYQVDRLNVTLDNGRIVTATFDQQRQ